MPRVAALGWTLFLLLPAIVASAQSQDETQKFLKVAISGQPWAVQVNEPGFVVDIEMPGPGEDYMQAHNKEKEIDLSVRLERQSKSQTGVDGCRDWLSSERTRISSITMGKATNLSSREINGVPVFEYSLNVMGLKSQVFLACMAKGEFSIELNISKDKFKPNDEQLLTSILDATQIVTTEPASLPESGAAPKPGTSDLAQSQAKASEPPPVSPAPDLYRSSFSGDKYTNEFFNFSIVPPQGWEHANPDFLKKEDEKRRGQERDAVAKQTGRADLVNSGVLEVPLSYTLMKWRNNTGSGEPTEDYSVIIIEAAQQSLPGIPPELRGVKGSCSDVYYQDAGGFRGMKSLGKVTDVQFGGRTFAQEDFKFKENGKDHFLKILATCADKYYLAFHFAAYTSDEVKGLADVAKSIIFKGPAEK